MKKYYSPDDVVRWQASIEESVALHLKKLSEPGLLAQRGDFDLSMLSLTYCDFGMMCIAQGEFQDASKMFSESVRTRCKMFELIEEGLCPTRPIEAGDFPWLLIAFVTKDEDLIARVTDLYKPDKGIPSSIYLGRVLKLLAKNDTSGAKAALAQKVPRFETEVVGYADCLEAIADKDEQRFALGLKVASESWRKCAARRDKGLPFSVCFIQGVGLVRLAERVLGRRVSVDNEYIPSQLLQ
jgi:hypothetical protein